MDLQVKVLSMFEKLSIYLPLFETWARLFPEAEYSELSECLKETCVHFIAFIVNAIKYLRRPAIS